MRQTILAFTALILSACATSHDYEGMLDNWVGSSQTVLLNSWGNPASVTTMFPGEELWTYYQTSPTGAIFCRTTFTITNGVINDFAFEGDNCE